MMAKRWRKGSTRTTRIAKKSNFEILQEILNTAHLLKLLDKMNEYEMDPTRTVGATERTWDAGRTSFSMNKPTTWCKSGRVSLVSSSCLYKTQPERALAQVCHTRIDALSPDEYQFHLLLHRNSHHRRMDGWTDRRMKGEKPIYPPTALLCVGHNDIHFQYQLRESQDAYLVQIWWF